MIPNLPSIIVPRIALCTMTTVISTQLTMPFVDAAPIPEEEVITLRAGTTETITFYFVWTLNHSHDPFYTIGYKFMDVPFGGSGDQTNPDGLRDESQRERFHYYMTSVQEHSSSIHFTIVNVTDDDEGQYESKLYVFNEHDFEEISSVKIINVLPPPDRAQCVIKSKNFKDTGLYEVDCDTSTGAALTCFQNDTRNSHIGYDSDNGRHLRAKFLLIPITALYCCSHFKNQNVTQETCNDYEIPILDQSHQPDDNVSSHTGSPQGSNEDSSTTQKSSIGTNLGCYGQCHYSLWLYIINYIILYSML